jgi:molybdopterin converting factor subunit 1
MRIRALFFASYREIAGAEQLDVMLPAGARISDLVMHLRAGEGRWAGLPERPAVAVNLTYAPLSTVLAEGDEVAFIPPVSGG